MSDQAPTDWLLSFVVLFVGCAILAAIGALGVGLVMWWLS